MNFRFYLVNVNHVFINNIRHWKQNDSNFKDLIYTYIIIRVVLEGLNRHLIYELNSSNGEPVHIDWQINNIYGASQPDVNLIYDIFKYFGFK